MASLTRRHAAPGAIERKYPHTVQLPVGEHGLHVPWIRMTTSFERAVARSARKPASDHACTCSIKQALSAASCEANALGSVYPINGAVNVSSAVNRLVSQVTTSRPHGGS